MTAAINLLGIDTLSSNQRKLMKDLKALSTTVSVLDGGVYREDTSLCQIHIETRLTEKELDNWLWTEHCDYLGTYPRQDIERQCTNA